MKLSALINGMLFGNYKSIDDPYDDLYWLLIAIDPIKIDLSELIELEFDRNEST